jgi:hypothetical protein
MKKFGHASLGIAVLSTVLLIGMSVFTIEKLVSNAAVSDWQQGASIVPKSPDDFSSDSFKQSVKNLQATGANSVSLIIPYWQSNDKSSDIQNAANTPTDQSLTNAINFVHSLGMQVMLKPHLEAANVNWRAFINPTDRATWYKNYSAMLDHLGDIGKQTNVEIICIGTELIDTAAYTQNADNTQQWINMINDVRTHYSGKLTYSANWGDAGGFADEMQHIGFWPNLDYIGLSAYFNLNANSTDYNSLKGAWDFYRNNFVEPLFNQYHKQIIFTEVGYRSVTGAHNQPWNYALQGASDQQEQANDYDALFRYWDQYPYMVGVQLWNWDSNPNAGGAGNTDYTPQNKLAQTTMQTWFGGANNNGGTSTTTNSGGNNNPPPTPPPPPVNTSPSFTSSPTVKNSANVGDSVTITAPIMNSGGAVSNTIVGVQVYNSANGLVNSQFFSNQNFAQGETKTFTSTWIPKATGDYKIFVNVQDQNWKKYYDGTNLAFVHVGTGQTQTPPPVNPPPVNPPPVNPPPVTPPVTPPTNGGSGNANAVPEVTTLKGVTQGTTALIGGGVNMHGGAGHVWFEYGTNPRAADYNTAWPWKADVQHIDGNGVNRLTILLTNLSPHTTYYYRIMAENEIGKIIKTNGEILSFTTQ